MDSKIGTLSKDRLSYFLIDGVKLMILNNLHLFHPFFSARPYGLAELEGQGRSALGNPHFQNSASGIFRIYKDRFSNHRFDTYKDKYLFNSTTF